MALNLVQHRGEPSIWDRNGRRSDWDAERWVLGVTAAVLVLAGFRRRKVTGLGLAMAGASLAWLAAATADERCVRRGRLRAVWPRAKSEDLVAEASEASFPASDAPAWTPTTGNTGPADAGAKTR